MNKEERECRAISHLIRSLAITCAASPIKITDLLADYLFSEEEAGCIRETMATWAEDFNCEDL